MPRSWDWWVSWPWYYKVANCGFDFRVSIKTQQFLKFVYSNSRELDKFYIIINIFLNMMITKYQWLLKIIQPVILYYDLYIFIYDDY